MRENFTKEVINQVAARVNYVCSRSACSAPTSGPQIDSAKSLNLGVAAHLSAASPGGPRYNPSLTSAERTSHNNAIWLCQNCAKLIDNDEARFTENELKQWKRDAEARALARIGKTATAADPKHLDFSEEELMIMISCAERGDIFLLTSDEAGAWVRSGTQDLIDGSDPAFSAHYVEALDSLCQSGLVRHDEGALYKLTGRGFTVARALKQNQTEGSTSPPAFNVTVPVTGLTGLVKLDVNVIRPAKPDEGGNLFPVLAQFENLPSEGGSFNDVQDVWAHITYREFDFLEMELARVSSGCWIDQPVADVAFPIRTPRYLMLGAWHIKPMVNEFRIFEYSRELHRAEEKDVKIAGPKVPFVKDNNQITVAQRRIVIDVVLTSNGHHDTSCAYQFHLTIFGGDGTGHSIACVKKPRVQ